MNPNRANSSNPTQKKADLKNQAPEKDMPENEEKQNHKTKKEAQNSDEQEFKQKYLKARNKTIDLFGRHMDNIKLKNEIKEQRDEIERQRKKIELAYNRARKRTIELYGKHSELKKATKRIEFQQHELLKTNKELEKKNREINDSIEYAKKIQDATLPSIKKMNKYIKDFFILFMPRDVVSGDFFWFHRKENELYMAVADCTGHGIPGAFMSILASTLLNDIISLNIFSSPAVILKELNSRIVKALQQDANQEQSDGMDISLCRIDIINKEFEIACANQDAYLVLNNELILIESDLFSVGGNLGNQLEIEYTNRHFQIQENTKLYLLSDGFKDQFGGSKNKKYGIYKQQELFTNCQTVPFGEQKEFMEKEFKRWKHKNKQIDDILIFGIELDSLEIC